MKSARTDAMATALQQQVAAYLSKRPYVLIRQRDYETVKRGQHWRFKYIKTVHAHDTDQLFGLLRCHHVPVVEMGYQSFTVSVLYNYLRKYKIRSEVERCCSSCGEYKSDQFTLCRCDFPFESEIVASDASNMFEEMYPVSCDDQRAVCRLDFI